MVKGTDNRSACGVDGGRGNRVADVLMLEELPRRVSWSRVVASVMFACRS